MSIYKQFKTNQTAEREGVDVSYGLNDDGSEILFRIARMSKSNIAYQKAVEKAMKPHRRAIELETIDPKLAESLMMSVFCETVLIGWSNVLGEDGKVVPYSADAAKKIMSDLPDLYADLQRRASDLATFRDEEIEAEAKN